MNKIYKVVWNAARNCYVVGSEFISKTRRGGGYCHSVRRGGTKALAAAMTVLALTAGYGVLPVQGAEIPVQVTIDPSSDPEEYVVGVEGSALAVALDGQEVDVDALDALAVQYDGANKSQITFAGTNGTALNNVNDIVMNVENPINHKAEQHSFQNAGLLPGKVEGTATDGKWNMAIGEGSEIEVDGGTGANMQFNTAIGNSAGVSQNIVNGDYVDVERSTAIGHAAKVSASNSTAIGDSSNAGEDNSVAIGQKAEVQSATSIAIGQGTKIGGNAENSIAIGTSANQYSVGSKAKNSTVVGVNAWSLSEGGTVLGKSAKIQGSAANGTAIGTNATINVSAGSGNVALGADSTVSKADVGDDTEHGVVSVGQSGDNGFSRRIINVADGVNDSDAATYGQVKGVQARVDALNDSVVTYDNDTKDTITLAAVEDSTALNDNNIKGTSIKNVNDIVMQVEEYSASSGRLLGYKSFSFKEAGLVPGDTSNNGSNSVAIGSGSKVVGGQWDYDLNQKLPANGVAIGADAIVDSSSVNGTVIGQGAEVRTDNATAIGQGSRVVSGDGSVALGQGSMVTDTDAKSSDPHGVVSVGLTGNKVTEGFTRRIINVADGVNDSDAATVKQVKAVQGDVDELNKLAVTYTDNTKKAVKFNGATLKNVGDIQIGNAQSTFAGSGLINGKVYNTEAGTWAENGANATHSMAVGSKSSVRGKDSIAVGPEATVNDGNSVVLEQSTAVGSKATVTSSFSTALGANTQAKGDYSVAIGADSQATGANATAIGAHVGAGENSVVIGGGTSLAAARAGKANATAIGTYVDINADKGTAIGYGAQIGWNGKNSVSLGADSIANEEGVVSVGHVKGQANGFGGTYDDDLKRRIINVADGINDTDAATVGQIKTMTGVDTGLGAVVQYDTSDKTSVTFNNGSKAGSVLNNVNDIVMQVEEYNTSGNVSGYKSLSFKDAGIIPGSVKDGVEDAVALGNESSVTANNGVAIGNDATVKGRNSVAIGQGAKATDVEAVAVGHSSDATDQYATALGDNSNASGESSTAVGHNAFAYADDSTALGANANVASTAAGSVALGQGSKVVTNDVLESESHGVVSVGASSGSSSFTRRIINVADGVNDSDAATVGQIKTITGIDSEKGNVVQYDNANRDQITFGGTNGTALLNISNLSAKTATIGAISFADDGRITNVTAGVNDSDVATVGQIKNLTGLDSTQGSVVQYDKDGNLNVSVGDSGLNVDDTAASLSHGANSVSVGADGTTVTGDLNVTGDLTFNGETVSSDDLANAANVAGDVSDIKEQIGAGTDGTLGLTNEQTTLVGGINANTEAINGVKTIVGDGKLDNGAADLTAGINANSAAIEQNRQAIGALGSRVSDLGEEVDSVGAISAALAGLHPLDYNGTGSKFQISAALGTYDGTQAAAIGGFYHFNRDTLLSIGGSTSFEGDRKTAANVGVTFRVGEGASEAPAVQDNETKQQMEAMKQEIEMLKAELEQLKNKDTEGTNDKN